MSRSSRSFIAALLFSVVGLACAVDSYQKVPRPDLDLALTNPQSVRVYVVRDSQVRGSIRSIRVYDGQKEIGVIGPKNFLCWERVPGRSILKLVYEGPVIDGGEKETLVDLPLAAGEVAYCVIHVDAKGDPIAELHPAEEAEAWVEAASPAPVN